MKQNKIEESGRTRALVLLGVIGIVLVGGGLIVGYNALAGLCRERAVIVNMEQQVRIDAGKMVKADVLAEEFDLREGTNLSLVDFAGKRREILRRIPNLKDITIVRTLPNRVTIRPEERLPVARVNLNGQRTDSGKVVDTEGVVFCWQRDTHTLPVIREAQAPVTPVGHRLAERNLAALRLIEAGRASEFAELGLCEVNTTKADYLLATLGNGAVAKIAWESMNDADSPTARASLNRQLTRLVRAYGSRLGERARVWNATDPTENGYIYADSKGNLQ